MHVLHTADECSTTAADCVDNSTCINSPDGFVCFCDFGLTGDGKMSGSGCIGKSPVSLVYTHQLSVQLFMKSSQHP